MRCRRMGREGREVRSVEIWGCFLVARSWFELLDWCGCSNWVLLEEMCIGVSVPLFIVFIASCPSTLSIADMYFLCLRFGGSAKGLFRAPQSLRHEAFLEDSPTSLPLPLLLPCPSFQSHIFGTFTAGESPQYISKANDMMKYQAGTSHRKTCTLFAAE